MRRTVVMLVAILGTLSVPGLAQAMPSPSSVPTCSVADVPTAFTGYDQWPYTMVDTHFRLPADYAPPDLVSTAEAGLNGGHELRAFVIPHLKAMAEAAAAAGHPIAVQSAYRSYQTQVTTFQYWVKVDGYAYALKSSARPGHSEHQLGTTLDLRAKGGKAPWDYQDWAATPTGAWVAANAWRFGFAMSYPRGSEAQTCYMYEPWHYRYLGLDEAQAIHDQGVTPRAYLWAHWQASGAPVPTASASSASTSAPSRTVTVQPGDTLWGLAQRYGTTVAALRRANGLQGNVIEAGMQLVIP